MNFRAISKRRYQRVHIKIKGGVLRCFSAIFNKAGLHVKPWLSTTAILSIFQT